MIAPIARSSRDKIAVSRQLTVEPDRRVPRPAPSPSDLGAARNGQIEMRPAADGGPAQRHDRERNARQEPAELGAIGGLESGADHGLVVPASPRRRASPAAALARCGFGRRNACRARRPCRCARRRRQLRHDGARLARPPRRGGDRARGVEPVEPEIDGQHLVVAQIGDDATERAGDRRESAAPAPIRSPTSRISAPACSAPPPPNGIEGELRRIVPALDRDEADGAGHAGIRDLDDRFGGGGTSSPRGRPTCARMARFAASTSSRASLPPIGRSALMRPSTTLASVSVGRVVAAAVAGRPRNRARAFRPDLEQAAVVDRCDRAAARADRRDLDHRRADDEAEIDGGLRRKRRLWPPAISDTSKEVPPRSPVITFRSRSAARDRTRGDDAGRRPRERGAHRQAPCGRRRHHAAVRLHDVEITPEAARRQGSLELAEIRADDRLQIGVERRRRAALEFADLRQDLARGRDMLIGPDRPHGLGRAPLILRIGEGVDENDGDGLARLFR